MNDWACYDIVRSVWPAMSRNCRPSPCPPRSNRPPGYGKDGYRHGQAADLNRIAPRGHHRLVKVFTIVRHIDGMEPAAQCPVGGAHLQGTLVKPRDFICGAFVDGACLAPPLSRCRSRRAHRKPISSGWSAISNNYEMGKVAERESAF
ncbi:hypothetical protein [Novosphingobium sp. KACC 22771]|uniref:hypothetical protein n=1 Tax=Novosphingobium sp. KACC 22771 TaxID=3025670 RepID=UPI002366565D|nr:hypothetical protein [Novosphingobium sp. KACC 22771]WDF73060.1 hypothetical protein PQ467_03190 [Novosphingobium sp. KACC 22771]